MMPLIANSQLGKSGTSAQPWHWSSCWWSDAQLEKYSRTRLLFLRILAVHCRQSAFNIWASYFFRRRLSRTSIAMRGSEWLMPNCTLRSSAISSSSSSHGAISSAVIAGGELSDSGIRQRAVRCWIQHVTLINARSRQHSTVCCIKLYQYAGCTSHAKKLN